MRILLLSFYYPPDLSAGSFRAEALVAALRERAPPGTKIDVITTLPNRYRSYAHAAAELERHDGVTVHRLPVPAHRSDMVGQSLTFLHFARQAGACAKRGDYDAVFATSSRLLTASLAAWIARRTHVPLYLDIRDIFVDTISDVLPRVTAWPVKLLFSFLETWTIRSADRVNLVSPGFERYFSERHCGRTFSVFTNGIDDEFLDASSSVAKIERKQPLTVLYAGNIGESQALHRVLPGLAAALAGRAQFVVIGDGGRRIALEQALATQRVDNVELRAPLPRRALLDAYAEADVLFLHLGPQRAFERVLPSKVFEYAALGKPILAGVGGFAAEFVRREIDNAGVFQPCDVAAAVHAFEALEMQDRARPNFVRRYSRREIARAMADDVLELIATARPGGHP